LTASSGGDEPAPAPQTVTPKTGARTLVIGLGNEYAGDDAVGVLAARALSAELAGVADVVESAASGLALLEDFAGYDRAIVIDAILTGRHPPGSIIEMSLTDLGPVVAPSAHQAGMPELAVVAGRLGLKFPAQTRVLAVEVAGPPAFGEPLSEAVAAAIGPLRESVTAQLERWAREDDQDDRYGGGEEGECTTTTP
jgi:hydrogenase maturation protease